MAGGWWTSAGSRWRWVEAGDREVMARSGQRRWPRAVGRARACGFSWRSRCVGSPTQQARTAEGWGGEGGCEAMSGVVGRDVRVKLELRGRQCALAAAPLVRSARPDCGEEAVGAGRRSRKVERVIQSGMRGMIDGRLSCWLDLLQEQHLLLLKNPRIYARCFILRVQFRPFRHGEKSRIISTPNTSQSMPNMAENPTVSNRLPDEVVTCLENSRFVRFPSILPSTRLPLTSPSSSTSQPAPKTTRTSAS